MSSVYVVIGFGTKEIAQRELDLSGFLGHLVDSKEHPEWFAAYLNAVYPEHPDSGPGSG